MNRKEVRALQEENSSLRKEVKHWKKEANGLKTALTGVAVCLLVAVGGLLLIAIDTHNNRVKNTSSALSGLDYSTRYASSMVASIAETALEDDIRIPVILNASCTFWVDQNGDLMSIKDANAFFAKNRDLAEDIQYLNTNPYYITTLYSSERKAFLDESHHIWYDAWSKAAQEATDSAQKELYKSRPTYDARSKGICTELSLGDQWDLYLQLLTENGPSIDALYDLGGHFGYNFASGTVTSIIRDRGTRQVSAGQGEPGERLFFACLAKFREDGTMETLHDQTSERIPLVLLADGTWYDQHGEAMDTDDAHRYLDAHPDTKDRIYVYNHSFNPYLVSNVDLPATHELESIYDNQYVRQPDDHEDSYLCYRAVEELLAEATPNDESIAIVNAFLEGRGIFYYSETAAINQATQTIADLLNPKSDLMKVYGHRYWEDYSAELFVLALYNLNDNVPLKPYLARLRVTYGIEDSLEDILVGQGQSTAPRASMPVVETMITLSENQLEKSLDNSDNPSGPNTLNALSAGTPGGRVRSK